MDSVTSKTKKPSGQKKDKSVTTVPTGQLNSKPTDLLANHSRKTPLYCLRCEKNINGVCNVWGYEINELKDKITKEKTEWNPKCFHDPNVDENWFESFKRRRLILKGG